MPTKFDNVALKRSHDQEGHLGVQKIYDHILCFFVLVWGFFGLG